MTYVEMKRILGLKTSRKVDAATKLLEANGKKFCVDFGVDNAIEKAKELPVPLFTAFDLRLLRKMGISFMRRANA